MSTPTAWDSVRELIGRQDLIAAAETLEKWLKGRIDGPKRSQVEEWLDEVNQRAADARTLATKVRRREIAEEQQGIERRLISKSLMDLLRLIEAEDLSSSPPIPSPPNIPARYVEGKFEKIWGNKSKLQMVSWLAKGVECSEAVCRLIRGSPVGTGFRVQGDLLITNNHVIPNGDVAASFVAQFFFEENVDHTMREALSVKIDSDRFWTSKALDITIVGARFEQTSANTSKEALTIRPAKEPEVGDPVSIIQHPLGGPKQIAVTGNEVINIYEHRIQYVTDTLPGSSGSPVFNTNWEVIAVHHSGGQLLKNSAGDELFANEGTSVTSLLAVPEARKLLGL